MGKQTTISQAIMMLESGQELELSTIAKLVQVLIDSRVILALQGSYQRLAQRLIEEGLCKGFTHNKSR
jgi:hypothetical protein